MKLTPLLTFSAPKLDKRLSESNSLFSLPRNRNSINASKAGRPKSRKNSSNNEEGDLTGVSIIWFRQQLFQNRKWACKLTTIMSIYGLIVGLILAELEMDCLEGNVGYLGYIEEISRAKGNKTWFPQYDCNAPIPDIMLHRYRGIPTDSYYQFCNASKTTENEGLVIEEK